jgi:hypothetical protein
MESKVSGRSPASRRGFTILGVPKFRSSDLVSKTVHDFWLSRIRIPTVRQHQSTGLQRLLMS